MKNTVLKSVLAIVMAFMALPMVGQDWMEIHFKEGDSKVIYLKNVISILTSQYDEEGVLHNDSQYQHITTKQNMFVYNIADIDSITFLKYDEEKVLERIVAAQNVVDPIILNCETAQDVEKYIDQIKNTEGVEDAWICGNSLFVKIEGWEQIAYHLEHETPDVPDMTNISYTVKKAVAESETKTIQNDGNPLKVIIANQEHYDTNRRSQIKSCMDLKKDFEDCNINARYSDRPKKEFFLKDMYYYDVVFLITHGDWDGQKHTLYTADSLGISFGNDSKETMEQWRSNMQKLREEIPGEPTLKHLYMGSTTEYRDGVKCLIKRPALTELFFSEIVDAEFGNPHSLFFNVACHSLQDNDNLGNSFFEKELGVYMGYTNANSVGDDAGIAFLRSMLEGKSFGVANHELDSKYKEEKRSNGEVAELRIRRNKKIDVDPRQLFLVSTLTIQKDNQTFTQEYDQKKSVTLEGITTILGKAMKPATMGFRWGTEEDLKNGNDIEASGFNSTDNKGNRLFQASLNNIERDKTYYYRAFTYDGTNHNYGDIFSFKIESDARELMITKTIGGTVYSIYKKTFDENDYRTNPDGWKCYRTELSLDITKNGKTNTYIVDNNIYLDKKNDHHGGQQPCMLLDFNKNMMYIFCNSKDDGPYYSMDGNFYYSSMNNINFRKETVFEGANWGWFPYFCDYGDDNIYLCNFSFAGYFTIMAVREDGAWELYYYNTDISPEEAQREWLSAGSILVIEKPS